MVAHVSVSIILSASVIMFMMEGNRFLKIIGDDLSIRKYI